MIELKNYIENTLLSPDANEEKLKNFFEISKNMKSLEFVSIRFISKKQKSFSQAQIQK